MCCRYLEVDVEGQRMRRAESSPKGFPKTSTLCPKGVRGLRGAPGPSGPLGDKGKRGLVGYPGPKGISYAINSLPYNNYYCMVLM